MARPLGSPSLTGTLRNLIAEGVMEEADERSESDIADERDRLLAATIGALAD